jgi:hypothetical protein
MQAQVYVEQSKELVQSKVADGFDRDLCPLLSLFPPPHLIREALTKTASQYLPLREAHLYMGRRLSMLTMEESIELREGPLSLTRSLMRMLGLGGGVDVDGGKVLPSLHAGGGCRAPLGCGGAA